MKNKILANKPLVSVIMPAYNAGRFLAPAIESILQQTYPNFEFIIVDDASIDNSWQIIQKYARKDKRIHAFRNPQNLGVSATANFAISLAKGQYIARMDADDVSLPYRLEKELKFLQQNPKAIAVSGQCLVINEKDQIIGRKTFPLEDKQLREMIFWAVPMQQPAMMINRKLLPKNFAWYSPKKTSAEEIDLLFQLMKYGQLINLPETVLYYRYLPNSLSHQNPKATFWLTLKSRIKAVREGYQPSAKGVALTLLQAITVAILPNKAITWLWPLIRGIQERQNVHYLPAPAPQPAAATI